MWIGRYHMPLLRHRPVKFLSMARRLSQAWTRRPHQRQAYPQELSEHHTGRSRRQGPTSEAQITKMRIIEAILTDAAHVPCPHPAKGAIDHDIKNCLNMLLFNSRVYLTPQQSLFETLFFERVSHSQSGETHVDLSKLLCSYISHLRHDRGLSCCRTK